MAAGRGIKNVTDTFAVEPFNVSPNVWWYAATSRQAIGSCAALLLLPAVAGMVLRRRQASDWVLPVSLLGGYVLLAAQPTYAWMYAAPVLPAVAVLLASWALSLRRRALKTLVTAALVAAAVFQFGWCSWGPWAWPGPSLVSRLGAQHGVRASCRYDRTLCATPPNPQPIAPDLEPLLGRMLRDPQCKKKRTCMVMVVGLSFPNPQMLSFHLRLRWPQARLHLVTQGSKKLGHRYPINKLLRSDFIVHPARLGQTHGRAKETLEFLRRPPSLWARRHRRVARFKSAGGPLILLKRVREFDLEEREAVADALGVGPYGLPLTSHRP